MKLLEVYKNEMLQAKKELAKCNLSDREYWEGYIDEAKEINDVSDVSDFNEHNRI